MPTYIQRVSIILTVAISLAVSPLCSALAECQKLGEYCGSHPTETFPACCPFDTDSNSMQIPLKCKNVDNGVGTCETSEEDSNNSLGENE